MAYGSGYTDDFCFSEMMRGAAGDPLPPEPGVAPAAPAGPAQTGVEPANLAWKPEAQIVKYSDGSQNAQLLGKAAAAFRWKMAKAYAVKLAPRKDGLAVLHDSERLEALDPKHRMGDLLDVMMEFYKADTPAAFHSKLSLFFMFVDGWCRDEPAIALEAMVKRCGEPNRALCEGFVQAGVAYKEGEQERKPYALTFNRGKVYQEGKPFDTKGCVTAHSGKGWAIYVASPHGRWYAGSHRVGAFHHSSFLGGRPVLSAGELQAANGTVTLLTAKSGHYQPTMEQFVAGLKSLRRAGVSLDQCQVEVYEARAKPVRIGAIPFLVNGALQARHLVWG
jgi:hypothetical protein